MQALCIQHRAQQALIEAAYPWNWYILMRHWPTVIILQYPTPVMCPVAPTNKPGLTPLLLSPPRAPYCMCVSAVSLT